MNQTFDLASWRQVVVDALTQLGANTARFLPHLVGAVVLLAVGWLVSKLVEVVVRRVLHRVGLDRTSAHPRVAEALHRAGVTAAPSWIFARLLFWAVMLTFVQSAVATLGLVAVTSTLERLVEFLPDVFAAGLIVVLGLLLGRFVRNVVSSGAAAANLGRAEHVGAAAGGLVGLFVALLALEQLGFETSLLVTVLTALVAAASLAIGLALAIGARPVVTHILAGHFLRQSLPRGSTVEVRGDKGTVERVGPVETLMRSGESSWSIPNGVLMNETIVR